MCGISGVINLSNRLSSRDLMKMNRQITHRGPDDEGFYLGYSDKEAQVLLSEQSALESRTFHSYRLIEAISYEDSFFTVGFGHRRLSILDLSPMGHQPMHHEESGITLTYNGEIYNYVELREELKFLGFKFKSQSDTEVLLLAWVAWGPACLNKLNGMFAFLIFDPRDGGKVFAVRDRFGVKPLYWTRTKGYMAFASEIKQLKVLPEYAASLNNEIVYDYLAFGQLDHTEQTFDTEIFQLKGGHYLEVNLSNTSYKIHNWYTLPFSTWKGSEKEAIEQYESLFIDAVRLRLRSDVPIGSCLSGGLDSSSIVCVMADLLKHQANACIQTVTACYNIPEYDEWHHAAKVIEKTGAKPHRLFPSLEELEQNLSQLLWHMDEPFSSTSQFSQWSVFKGVSAAGLKVVLNGQGADEQLAGYGGNDAPLYSGLLKQFHLLRLAKESLSYKKRNNNWPKGFWLQAISNNAPWTQLLIPKRNISNTDVPSWLKKVRLVPLGQEYKITSLREGLIRQTMVSSLPALLRYEDRNSMAWSVESRVPFMDYRLAEFTLNLPEQLVYREGTRKYILREAMKNTLPSEIYQRRDKMGFVTPEEVWFKGTAKGWFEENFKYAGLHFPNIFNTHIETLNGQFQKGEVPFSFSLWRTFSIVEWLKK